MDESTMTPQPLREAANRTAFERMVGSEPVLVGVESALAAVPGMVENLVLTSGPPMRWEEYTGGQRAAVIGGALYEGLAADAADADRKLRDGQIRVGSCQDYGCVGSIAGIYTASMPVLVVENTHQGNTAFCNLFEGESPKRLNYGVYDDDVGARLKYIEGTVGPLLGQAVRASGGIALKPLMARALRMGDELHSRNTASTLLFTRALFPSFLELSRAGGRLGEAVPEVVDYLSEGDYFFLRLAMAASKAAADAAHDIQGSSVVSAMGFNCKEFGIRVSGLGESWFRAEMPLPSAKLFDGYAQEDIESMGGESPINETVGLGGFAQAAAFPLQAYQGGDPEEMCRMNLDMYKITVGEHPDYRIPYFKYRGTPTGIDIHRVLETGITPVIDIGIAGRGGGQIGAGILRPPIECFRLASQAHASPGEGGLSHTSE